VDDHGSSENRRDFLKCMARAGTGALFTVGGGIPSPIGLDAALAAVPEPAGFRFLQISDSHIGFAKPANPDARATCARRWPSRGSAGKPDFIIHTDHVSQLSRDEEFDDAHEILRQAGVPLFFIPGEPRFPMPARAIWRSSAKPLRPAPEAGDQAGNRPRRARRAQRCSSSEATTTRPTARPIQMPVPCRGVKKPSATAVPRPGTQ